jgi:hypothetical protein
MNYDAEDKEDKKYKKGYGRKEFKQDVADAVKPVVEKMGNAKKRQGKKKMEEAVTYPTTRKAYAKMSAAALRKLLVDKKKKLLTKSGFPQGGIPRSKADMINLCLKLKRKRW